MIWSRLSLRVEISSRRALLRPFFWTNKLILQVQFHTTWVLLQHGVKKSFWMSYFTFPLDVPLSKNLMFNLKEHCHFYSFLYSKISCEIVMKKSINCLFQVSFPYIFAWNSRILLLLPKTCSMKFKEFHSLDLIKL